MLDSLSCLLYYDYEQGRLATAIIVLIIIRIRTLCVVCALSCNDISNQRRSRYAGQGTLRRNVYDEK